ncbi:hypothetical protein FJZ23_01060 [Candidatus Parcubacteria bacterium]|nr:hypothetical protein [Candidatus Parcubacteria bacterium]
MSNHQNRPARNNNRHPIGDPRNDNMMYLAHERQYSRDDLQTLAGKSAEVMGVPVEESVAFAGNPHRALAAVRTALCLLGFRAEHAIMNGVGPGTAWAPFDDLMYLARTLGAPAEKSEERKPAPPRPADEDEAVRAPLAGVKGAETLAALRDQLPASAQTAPASVPTAQTAQTVPSPEEIAAEDAQALRRPPRTRGRNNHRANGAVAELC